MSVWTCLRERDGQGWEREREMVRWVRGAITFQKSLIVCPTSPKCALCTLRDLSRQMCFTNPQNIKKKQPGRFLVRGRGMGRKKGCVCVYVGGRWVGKKGDCFRLRYIQLFAKLASDSRP